MMKRNVPLLWIVVATLIVLGGGRYLAFGDSAEDAPKNDVAILDVSRIFKEHKRFRAQLEGMKKEVEAAEAALRMEAEEIKAIVAEAASLDQGEPLKQQLENEAAERQVRVQLKMSTQKKEFMEQEADLYRDVYTGIETVVADYCRAHGIKLVLRYNRIDWEEDSSRKAVLAGVNRAVVYQDGIDITEEILARVNQAPPEGDL